MYKHNADRPGPVPAAVPVHDWSRLCRSDHVEVRSAGGETMSGAIDMIAADSSVFWMIRDDGAGRTMLCCGDDVTVVKIASANPMAGLIRASA
ncbi:hypothetical protein QF038_003792 [Pseudarthrobacter sp. W1I19]|uniref:hypothetical protein n=1 Tax=Pseudarthrobacter sp. W1I19 TaxID=3042288 RepID=UPI002780D6CF|nr:hypothetical protein [Pseudarthrobacter sp. W1I19]MDQ0925284.1 hypothetical protein [Pseudarthrobacter sp. W1I19]